MNRPLYYYAKLNENDICYGFESLPKKLSKEELGSGRVLLTEQNETYLFKKYDRELKAFGQETYEPSIDAEIQDRLENLETENTALSTQVGDLNSNIQGLNGVIMELTTMISLLQGGN